ncbi:hypothetical protein PFY01_11755 [Brevundimonas vesicularis]|uniref:hypothetical protein n=1 Tax=Brevundimonas vesicularis TaxID=41276 RepID=UPI0022EC614D|nr:hypothetical protein [Brevundimonas vesicularis]WBT05391.1 hypothetical protein PFY01_11755 [Brevundimonas vesicularis]
MIETVKTPWHLWLVGVLSLLWNGFGAFDFIQTTTRGEAYMRAAGFDDAMVAYYEAMPGWMYVPWTLGVWGAVIGSVMLLLRRRWAVPAFGLSLLGALISLIYGKLIDPPPPAPPELTAMRWIPIFILLIAILLFGYAFNMRKRGVLR